MTLRFGFNALVVQLLPVIRDDLRGAWKIVRRLPEGGGATALTSCQAEM